MAAESFIAALKYAMRELHTFSTEELAQIEPLLEEMQARVTLKNVERAPVPYSAIVDLFHKHCPKLPAVKMLNNTRRSALRTRWYERPEHSTLDFWDAFFRRVGRSAFLNGASSRGWRAGFDWLLCPRNFAKVLEGNYDTTTDARGNADDYNYRMSIAGQQ